MSRRISLPGGLSWPTRSTRGGGIVGCWQGRNSFLGICQLLIDIILYFIELSASSDVLMHERRQKNIEMTDEFLRFRIDRSQVT
jgi:hypothetical protein